MKGIERAQDRVLRRQAFMVRKAARDSIAYRRSRKRNAPAGRPPFKHGRGKATVAYITYAYDKHLGKSIVGPEKLVGARNTPLKALEFGGRSMRRLPNGHWINQSIAARPYMLPALERQSSKFAAMWKDSVR